MDKYAFEAELSYQLDKTSTASETEEKKAIFEKVKAKAASLPLNSGVYMHKDENGEIIYIGKAKSLRKRVMQYFLAGRDRKTAALVEKIRDIDYIITGNDYEALVLENNLIKKYTPHYNILLKDGKSYPVIKISKEDFPKVYRTRRILKDGSAYYGPYPDATRLVQYLDIIDKMFNLRKCASPLRKKNTPCLYYHIRRCPAPCCGKITKEEYAKSIDKIKKLLSGGNAELENEVKAEMEAAASKLDFETAAKKRDILLSLQNISKEQMVQDFTNTDARDYAAIEMRSPLCTVSIMQFRDGKLMGRAIYRAQTFGDESETLLGFLIQYYEESSEIPKEMYVSHDIDTELIQRYFKENLNRDVNITVPTDGRDYRILRMARENAERDVEKRLKSRDNSAALEVLKDICGLEEAPHLIEGFDIAQLSGKYTVASLISFVDGNPNPQGYRRFNIQTTDGAIDDYASMREAVYRRYTRVLSEGLEKPDLVLIDGGKGQVNVARDVLDSIGMADTPVVGLAEKHEIIVFDDDRPDLALDHSNEGLRILISVRDECHRYATSANQAMRSKEASFHLLESINGIGKKTSEKIMSSFTSLDDVLSCSADEIAERAKISRKIAEKLLEKFKMR